MSQTTDTQKSFYMLLEHTEAQKYFVIQQQRLTGNILMYQIIVLAERCFNGLCKMLSFKLAKLGHLCWKENTSAYFYIELIMEIVP